MGTCGLAKDYVTLIWAQRVPTEATHHHLSHGLAMGVSSLDLGCLGSKTPLELRPPVEAAEAGGAGERARGTSPQRDLCMASFPSQAGPNVSCRAPRPELGWAGKSGVRTEDEQVGQCRAQTSGLGASENNPLDPGLPTAPACSAAFTRALCRGTPLSWTSLCPSERTGGACPPMGLQFKFMSPV